MKGTWKLTNKNKSIQPEIRQINKYYYTIQHAHHAHNKFIETHKTSNNKGTSRLPTIESKFTTMFHFICHTSNVPK